MRKEDKRGILKEFFIEVCDSLVKDGYLAEAVFTETQAHNGCYGFISFLSGGFGCSNEFVESNKAFEILKEREFLEGLEMCNAERKSEGKGQFSLCSLDEEEYQDFKDSFEAEFYEYYNPCIELYCSDSGRLELGISLDNSYKFGSFMNEHIETEKDRISLDIFEIKDAIDNSKLSEFVENTLDKLIN